MQLYLVRMSSSVTKESFYKIGVSDNAAARFSFGSQKVADSDLGLREKLDRILAGQRYVADHPYDVEPIHTVGFTYEGEARLHERELLALLKPSQIWPRLDFSGRSECFRDDDTLRDIVIEYMDKAAADANASEPSAMHYAVAAMGLKEQDPVLLHLKKSERIKRYKETGSWD